MEERLREVYKNRGRESADYAHLYQASLKEIAQGREKVSIESLIDRGQFYSATKAAYRTEDPSCFLKKIFQARRKAHGAP